MKIKEAVGSRDCPDRACNTVTGIVPLVHLFSSPEIGLNITHQTAKSGDRWDSIVRRFLSDQ